MSVVEDTASTRSRGRSVSVISDYDGSDNVDSEANHRMTMLFNCVLQSIRNEQHLPFYWALLYETETNHFSSSNRKLVSNVLYKRLLESSGETGVMLMTMVVKEIFHCLRLSNSSGESNRVRSLAFRRLLAERLASFFPTLFELSGRVICSPLSSTILLVGIDYDACKVFASSRSPALVQFRVRHDAVCSLSLRLIFKQGDDLRIDQLALVLQVALRDILLSVGLDLEVKLFQVIPTGLLEGMVESLDGLPLSGLTAYNNSIVNFLCHHDSDLSEDLGFSNATQRRFIASSAFACVFCWVLGVGDRHLDNIIICTDGTLVHIDFAYMLGDDPKYSSNLLRINPAMVEAMGGENSRGFEEFLRLSCLVCCIIPLCVNICTFLRLCIC
jgi:phosphatidylinositol 3-kinase